MIRPAFVAQLDIVNALVLRETKTRGGILAIVAEPIAQIAVFSFIFTFIDRAVPVEAPIWVFITSGVLVWITFSTTLKRVARSLDANQALLMHRPVTPLDAALSRVFLEFAVWSGLATIFTAYLFVSGYLTRWTSDYILLLSLASLSGSAFGILILSAKRVYPWVQQGSDLLLRILFFISCVFYSPTMLPKQAMDFILLNPIAHLVDATRATLFTGYPDAGTTLLYPLWVSLVALALALLTERATRWRDKS